MNRDETWERLTVCSQPVGLELRPWQTGQQRICLDLCISCLLVTPSLTWLPRWSRAVTGSLCPSFQCVPIKWISILCFSLSVWLLYLVYWGWMVSLAFQGCQGTGYDPNSYNSFGESPRSWWRGCLSLTASYIWKKRWDCHSSFWGHLISEHFPIPSPLQPAFSPLCGETEQEYLNSEFWRTFNLWYVAPHWSTSKFTFWFDWGGQGAEMFLLFLGFFLNHCWSLPFGDWLCFFGGGSVGLSGYLFLYRQALSVWKLLWANL